MLTTSDKGLANTIVCVPACNEADQIGNLLASLASQTVATPMRPLKVVVIINNSVDGTADIVESFQCEPRLIIRQMDITLPSESAHAGAARRLAINAGADWLEADAICDGVLLSTDADAIAPDEWVARNLAALQSADLVGGRLVISREVDVPASLIDLHARIELYWAAVRALEDRLDPPAHDPAPRHGDHTGASLALRAALYRAVGGVPPLATGEDNALVAAVQRVGGRVRHCPNVWIEVSGREVGRSSGGMAEEMARRRKALGALPYRLPSAAYWLSKIERRAAWRAEWPFQGSAYPNAIAYVAHREAQANVCPAALVPLDEEIAELKAMTGAASQAPA